jgi:hypothetical protein
MGRIHFPFGRIDLIRVDMDHRTRLLHETCTTEPFFLGRWMHCSPELVVGSHPLDSSRARGWRCVASGGRSTPTRTVAWHYFLPSAPDTAVRQPCSAERKPVSLDSYDCKLLRASFFHQKPLLRSMAARLRFVGRVGNPSIGRPTRTQSALPSGHHPPRRNKKCAAQVFAGSRENFALLS